MTYTGADVGIMWAEVGKYCCIARRVEIGGNEHNYRAASMMPSYRLLNKLGGKLSMHQDEEIVRVGNDVWIGVGALIPRKSGLEIGDGAVIGSGAVVTKSVPPYAIVAGVPAKVIRYRFDAQIIEKLQRLKWWDWEREKILEYWPVLSSDLTEEAVDALLAAQ
jgi:virginiamycin A acetyltransferase